MAGEIKVQKFRSEIWQGAGSYDFLTWIDEEIERLDIKHGTFKRYRTLSKRLHEFGEMRTWKDVTVEKITAF